MSPKERYAQSLEMHGMVRDAAQEQAVLALEDLHWRLVSAERAPLVKRWWRGALAPFVTARTEPVCGLYLWGGVGRGKTWLMDLFFESLPFDDKLRMHFHRFMRRVHGDLRALSGQANPLLGVADRFARDARVLCFDEFFVSDITDAMILGELLDALFARGVTLVATSNIPPSGLYRDGLQRRRFLPAIALLEQHTRVLNVDGGVDYRLRSLKRAEIYHAPLDAEAELSLAASFASLAPVTPVPCEVLEIEGRRIPTRSRADDVVWFDFAALCAGPRSQNDYIELAREFHAVLVSGVPRFTPQIEDQARRFISLVDEFYDRGVKLIVSAEVPLEALYGGERLAFEFERTRSRLLEMQSEEYLARLHRA